MNPQSSFIKHRLHLDIWLLMALLALTAFGIMILYSASEANMVLVQKQLLRFTIGLSIMFVFAQIPSRYYLAWAPWFYLASLTLLIFVLIIGHIGKGAQRWLNLGLFRFQPSEFMKLAVPMMLAWYLNFEPLPPKGRTLLVCSAILGVPVILTAIEPDLGTAIVITLAGGGVMILAGLRWRILAYLALVSALAAPMLWHWMHTYQKERVLTFFNPERDPLGAGYHIIQSKIAIGSGGFWGKGWMQGTQAHLQFLPEHATDFIFALCGEEFGFLGCILLIMLFAWVISRCLSISVHGKDSFSRLLAGSLTLTFFCSVAINIGMVSGLLPVVGLPLPLISYGGTSMVTFMAFFGIIMSIHSQKQLIDRQ